MTKLADPIFVDAHKLATDAVNAWRGRCLSAFTRAELAVTEALVASAATGSSISHAHLVGQRFAALSDVLATHGDPVTTNALKALSTFRRHDDLRVFLCHGHAKVTLDRSGGWQAVFTTLSLRRGAPERSMLVVEEHHAGGIAQPLSRDRQRLVVELDRLKQSLPAAAALAFVPVIVSAAG